jgi:hypothetical protein
MTLPFTDEQFFGVFAAYNLLLWPAALVLWVATAVVCIAWLRGSINRSPLVPALLAIHWIWVGLAYHAAFFTRINPAAWLFSGLFLVEAGLLTWYGVIRNRIRFVARASFVPHAVSWALIAYALAYPIIAQAEGRAYPHVPTFAVPCPTTILTIGFLLAADPPLPRLVAVIPILWALIGGSGAFLFGVRADLVLLVAGAVLIGDVLRRTPYRGSVRRIATRTGTIDSAPRQAHRSA